jgi:hypothetical protein
MQGCELSQFGGICQPLCSYTVDNLTNHCTCLSNPLIYEEDNRELNMTKQRFDYCEFLRQGQICKQGPVRYQDIAHGISVYFDFELDRPLLRLSSIFQPQAFVDKRPRLNISP